MNRRLLLGLTVLAGGCTLGPDYHRPELPVPQGWREVTAGEQESLANTPWWELFQDPELVQLIHTSLTENKDLAIAVERIEEARAIYGFTRADLYPRVDAGASVSRVHVSENGIPSLPSGVDNEGTIYSVGGAVSWELDFFGRVRRATEAELAQMYAAEQSRRAVVLSLVSDVAKAYVELRDLDRRVEIARRTLESRIAYVTLAKDRFEGGVTSELDYRQAEAEQHRTAEFLYEFEGLVKLKENEISQLLGRNPGAIARGRTLEEITFPPAVPSGLPSELLDRRPDVREAEELLASANARIGSAKALLFPSVSLTGAFGWQSAELDELLKSPSRAWSIGANLLQPIFNAGQNRRRVEVAESQQRQALSAYERSVLSAFREVEDSLASLKQSKLRLGSAGERVNAERKVLDLAETRYTGGVATYLEVLDAQRSLFDAELDETSARRDQFVALIQLYKALGGGWPQAAEAADSKDADAHVKG
ncbi:MAG TPA: efflux transporter outer membrane subunit [Planctomycetota bacterium]|jgi:multidrug efflux system outer membrane protein|nr:efflux transporter outer membrane subunit [Planctomycetota bacterium]